MRKCIPVVNLLPWQIDITGLTEIADFSFIMGSQLFLHRATNYCCIKAKRLLLDWAGLIGFHF